MSWRDILKAKTEAQKKLKVWTEEDWGTQTEHRAKEKGKTPRKVKTRGRMMPYKTYKKTPKGTLNYQDRKKQETVRQGKMTSPTGRNFSQKGKTRRNLKRNLKRRLSKR